MATIATLRPDGTFALTGWEADPHLKLDEAVTEADTDALSVSGEYVSGITAADTFTVTLGTASMGADVCREVTAWVRWRAGAGNVTMELMTGATVLASVSNAAGGTVSSDFVKWVAGGAVHPAALTQAEVDDLRIRITKDTSNATASRVGWVFAYAEYGPAESKVRYVGSGPSTPGASGNVTANYPTGGSAPVENDVIWLHVVSRDNVVSTLPAGWTKKAEFNNGATLRETLAWRRRAAGDVETSVLVTHTAGDSIIARTHVFRGAVATGDPFEATGGPTDFAASATADTRTMPTVTTLTNGAVILYALGAPDNYAALPAIADAAGMTVRIIDGSDTTLGTDAASAAMFAQKDVAGAQTGIGVSFTLPTAVVSTGWAGVMKPAGTAPANTVAPAVTGTAETGQTLSCADGTWAGDPTITFAYQWQRAGVDVGGATASTYVLQETDEGNAIRCVVTGTNGTGSASANSNAVTPLQEPANTVAPAITGIAQTGQTLTCSNGTWSNSPTGFTYQWKRGGVDIAGATASTYLLVVADEGAAVKCTVTASNANGPGTPADSNTVTPTAPGGPTPDCFVRVAGAWVPVDRKVRVAGAWV